MVVTSKQQLFMQFTKSLTRLMVQYITEPITQPPFLQLVNLQLKEMYFYCSVLMKIMNFFDSISTGFVLVGIKLLIHVLFLNFQQHKQHTTKTNIQLGISKKKKKDISYNQIWRKGIQIVQIPTIPITRMLKKPNCNTYT